VIRAVGTQAYELDLPTEWHIHPVISSEHLEAAPLEKDPFDRPQLEHPAPVVAEDDQYLVNRILQQKTRRYGRSQKEFVEYLVEWKGWEDARPTWVRKEDIDSALMEAFDKDN